MDVPDFVRGCIAPTFTAFDEQGALHPDGQRNLLDFMVRSKSINAFFMRSGMGQMFAFDFEDVKSLTRTACAHLAGKAPVIVGCNGVWDRDYARRPDPGVFQAQCVTLGQYAADQGANGVVFTMPEALVPGDGKTVRDVVLRFFERMNDAVSLPIFIYQPPGTGEAYRLTPELIATLAEMDHICAAKVSYSDMEYVLGLIRAVKDKPFVFITGVETVYFATLYAGSRAAIGQGACLNPSVLNAVRTAFLDGDRERALQAQEAVNLLVHACGNAPYFLKRYATEHGFPVPPHARPMPGDLYKSKGTAMTDEEYTTFKRLLEEKIARFPEPA